MSEKIPTVLIIEDSPTQARQIAANISEYDINVVLAGDGPQGLRLIAANDPDLIVLDVYMPKMDGYQVCRRLKRDTHTADIPVIMLTSADTDEDRDAGMRAGAWMFIPKGEFAIEHLLEALNQLGMMPRRLS